MLLFIMLLSGCKNNGKLTINIRENNYKLEPQIVDNCIDEKSKYYEYNGKKVYLICMNEINLELKENTSNLIRTLNDYFMYLESLIKNDTIIVYLDNKIEPTKINVTKDKIQMHENVDDHLIFKSKEESKNEMMETTDVWKDVMSNWTDEENSLSDNFIVKVKDTSLIKETSYYIESLENVDNVQYLQKNIDYKTPIEEFAKNFSDLKSTKFGDNNFLYKFENFSIVMCNSSKNKNIYIGKNINKKSICG